MIAELGRTEPRRKTRHRELPFLSLAEVDHKLRWHRMQVRLLEKVRSAMVRLETDGADVRADDSAPLNRILDDLERDLDRVTADPTVPPSPGSFGDFEYVDQDPGDRFNADFCG